MSDKNRKKSSPAYGYVTLTGSDSGTIPVNPMENVRFNQHGALENIKFSQSSGTLTVLESGDYKIEYILLIGGPKSTSVYGIFLNHSPVSLTDYGITRQVDNAILMLTGQAIIHIHRNTKIHLKNIGQTTDILLPFVIDAGVTIPVNAASLSIEKLS
ncbi:hypothetical protein ACFVSW_20365 [Neobacillus sp. NPDC058068]|uniref:hypothetical protein n=1 Tax=Neobacillus sp. NPDC058068 TaxID=3346325 RepID=UPI0036DE8658